VIEYHCKVTAYSGYKANEMPLSFTVDDNKLEVRDIICRWVEPEKDFFKVIADDDRVYTLSWNRKSDLWLIEKTLALIKSHRLERHGAPNLQQVKLIIRLKLES